jgi:hypothetical protein
MQGGTRRVSLKGTRWRGEQPTYRRFRGNKPPYSRGQNKSHLGDSVVLLSVIFSTTPLLHTMVLHKTPPCVPPHDVQYFRIPRHRRVLHFEESGTP